jgi:heme-degrading monooxygenase HmoA
MHGQAAGGRASARRGKFYNFRMVVVVFRARLKPFESAETLAAWREHPEHKAVQQRTRNEFFSEYRIQVCTPLRDYRFP